MDFLRKLFGGGVESAGKEKETREERNFDVLKYDGVAALRQNETEYAIQCFRHALDIHDDAETHDYLAQALIRHNEMREAYVHLERLAETEPDNVAILLRMADVAYMMEDYDLMTDVCERATAIDSGNAMASYTYARARIGKVDLVNAIALLTKAIALSCDEPLWDAYLLRGQTLLKMGDVVAAEHDADTMLGHITDNEDVLLLKARCREASADHDGALEVYGEAIAPAPFSVDAYRERAALRLAAGDAEGAGEDRQMVEELLRDDTSADSLKASPSEPDSAAGSGVVTDGAGVGGGPENMMERKLFEIISFKMFVGFRKILYFCSQITKEIKDMKSYASYFYFYFYFARNCEAGSCV